MSNALIYVRQSKTDKDSLSPDTQEQACRKLPAVAAAKRVTVLSDLGISGGKPPEKRPGYRALLAAIEASDQTTEPLVVAAYNQDRISRDNIDSLNFYALLEKRPWVEFVMVDGQFDRSAAGEFTWAVQAAAASHLRKITARKIKATYADLNKVGAPTGPAPLGYRYVGGDRASFALEPDPETADRVRDIFSRYATGLHSTREIADQLTAEKVPTSSRNGWMPDTIAGLLSNVAYIGKTYTVSRLRRKGDLIQAQWPAIVDEVTFQRVQDILKKRQHVNPHGGSKREYVFRGLLWCSECGRRFQSGLSGGTVWYRCGSCETMQPCEMGRHALKESELVPWAERLLGFSPLGSFQTRKHQSGSPESAREAIAKIDRMITRLGTRYQVEEITDEDYRDGLAKLRRQREGYVGMAAEEPDPAEMKTLYSEWQKGDVTMRRAVLSALFERIHVKDRKVIGYTPRIDRAKRVRVLLATAFDYADDGPGADIAGTDRERGGGGI